MSSDSHGQTDETFHTSQLLLDVSCSAFDVKEPGRVQVQEGRERHEKQNTGCEGNRFACLEQSRYIMPRGNQVIARQHEGLGSWINHF